MMTIYLEIIQSMMTTYLEINLEKKDEKGKKGMGM